MFHPRGQADHLEHIRYAALAFRGIETAVTQGHIDVVEQVQVRDEVETLEDETDLFVAHGRGLGIGQAGNIAAVQLVFAVREPFEQAGDIQKRGLARTGRTRYGHEFALVDVEGEVPERMGFDQFGAIDHGYVLQA